MPVIGLTGSFGSGKTTVAEMFRQAGARVIDADAIARDVVEPGSPALQEIVDQVGPDVLQSDGRLDRKALAKKMFANSDVRRQINQIIHPRVREIELRQLEQWRDEPLVVLCVPLLLENRMEHLVDWVVVVTVDLQTRYRRLWQRDRLTRDQVDARLAAQMPQEEKVERADYVIDNAGTHKETKQQVRELIQKLSPELARTLPVE
jgi:dephospho-CoA kinase